VAGCADARPVASSSAVTQSVRNTSSAASLLTGAGLITLPDIATALSDRHYVKLRVRVALTPGTKASTVDPNIAVATIRSWLAAATLADVSPANTATVQRLSARLTADLVNV
jgi:hypothetical protein